MVNLSCPFSVWVIKGRIIKTPKCEKDNLRTPIKDLPECNYKGKILVNCPRLWEKIVVCDERRERDSLI